MKALRCMIVGDGSVFEVDMDGRMVGRQLKEIIMDKLPDLIECEAEDLTLYAAKRDDHWLTMHDEDIESLEHGTIPPRIRHMMIKDNEIGRTDRVGSAKYGFPQDGDAIGDKIHVLVLRPKELPARESSGMTKGGVHLQDESTRGHVDSRANYNASKPVYKLGSQVNSGSNQGNGGDYLPGMYSQGDGNIHPHRLQRWSMIHNMFARNNEEIDADAMVAAMNPDGVAYIEPLRPIRAGDLETLATALAWVVIGMNRTSHDVVNRANFPMQIITPIVWAVAQQSPDIQVYIDLDLDGKRLNARAHFEFVMKLGSKQICIIEAVNDNWLLGEARAFLGCEVVADLDDLHETYAVVTNAEKWMFLRCFDERVLCDAENYLTFEANGAPNVEQLNSISAKLYSMLMTDEVSPA